jgi:membrane protein involved in colicin uptake
MKKMSSLVSVALLTVPLVTPFAAVQASDSSMTMEPTCDTRVVDAEVRVAQLRNEREQKRAREQATWNTQYSERLAKVDELLDDRRAQAATQLAERRERRDERVPESLKPARAAYRASMDAAIKERQTAHDAAASAFRETVKHAHDVRVAAVDAAIAKRKAAVDAALTTFKASCGGTAEQMKEARTAFRASVKAAHETAAKELKAAQEVYVKTVLEAKKVRNAAFEKARTDARAAMDAALQALKAEKTEAGE